MSVPSLKNICAEYFCRNENLIDREKLPFEVLEFLDSYRKNVYRKTYIIVESRFWTSQNKVPFKMSLDQKVEELKKEIFERNFETPPHLEVFPHSPSYSFKLIRGAEVMEKDMSLENSGMKQESTHKVFIFFTTTCILCNYRDELDKCIH